jgi:hypothetical protein
MRKGRSTSTPTREEAARIEACKSGPCVACAIKGRASWGGDYHHLLSGGIRRGHLFGVCLCAWHHRAVPDWGCTHEEMRQHYGPSLAEGSKPFHAVFGTDQDLLDKQSELLGETA